MTFDPDVQDGRSTKAVRIAQSKLIQVLVDDGRSASEIGLRLVMTASAS